jgi:hypothetical protein
MSSSSELVGTACHGSVVRADARAPDPALGLSFSSSLQLSVLLSLPLPLSPPLDDDAASDAKSRTLTGASSAGSETEPSMPNL